MEGGLSPYTRTLRTVISGSFRRHLSDICALKAALETVGVGVLSPEKAQTVNPDDEFVVLTSDPVSHPRLLQDSVFAKIRHSSFLTLANVDGYIGRAATLEIGYAIANGIAIYSLEPIEDPNISPYCDLLVTVFPDLRLDEIQPRVVPLSSNRQTTIA